MTPTPLMVEPLAAAPDATITVPGSKSHTNRALICAALAEGRSRLDGVLFADDTWAMMNSLNALGLDLATDPEGASVEVTGCGGDVPAGPAELDVVQSGTTGRFLLALLALGPGPYLIDGHPQLRARPVGPLVDAIRRLGTTVVGESLPLRVEGPRMSGGHVVVPGNASSQFLSGLLMSAPLAATTADDGAQPASGADGAPVLTIEVAGGELVSRPYVELTLATMADFGVHVGLDGSRFLVPSARYRATDIAIEPDASAATYFFAAAAITGGRVRITGLGTDTVQGDLGFVGLLQQMGATVSQGPDWTEVVGPQALQGIDVDMADMSDAAQTLAIVATFAETPTRVTGIGFIRHKETDRVTAVVTELQRRGIEASLDDDGFTVKPGRPQSGVVETYDDHRMAMSFALLGLRHPGIAIADPGCVAKTFPDYFSVLDRLRA
ncbi:MAG: 3-phosphoshikimate 1-carboxyvinyltransferase [Actinomycetota bacterium]